MPRRLLLALALCLTAAAQSITRQNLATILGFENGTPGRFPAGWGGATTATIFVDDQIFHGGRYSCRIERTPASGGEFYTISSGIPLDFAGKVITWSGYIKTDSVTGYVALWLGEYDAAGNNVAFGTLQGQNIAGTRDWARFTVSVNAAEAGKTLTFGFFLDGPGKAWVDDLELAADGIPVGQAANRATTVLDTDQEFNSGSRISLTNLSPTQIANLALLARVWGFLKYHHPGVTGGLHHWDFELFRIMPKVLAASDSAGAIQTIASWVAGQGDVPDCARQAQSLAHRGGCAVLPTADLALGVNVEWIGDVSLLGADLSWTLRAIYRNRKPGNSQFFVSLLAGASNPSFDHEPTYPGIVFSDSGYQLLALFRFWNMVQYFYPNRAIMSDDPSNLGYWNDVLVEFIPRIGLARTTLVYQQELMRFIAKINDTHANLWSSIAARPPIGSCQLPVDVRFVEGKAYIYNLTAASASTSGFKVGDLILQLDGVRVDDLIGQWQSLYADSNQAARLRDMGEYLTRGNCGAAGVTVDRNGATVSLAATRVPLNGLDTSRAFIHDLPGPAFQMLAPDVAYLKIGSVVAANSAGYVNSAAGARGWIIDIRNYPSEFVVFTLGQLLISTPTPFVRFTVADMTSPGAFHWLPPLALVPQQPHYNGKVVILVDETTQSSAEYHAMAFRSAPGAIVIGSTTAGADGNVSTVPLPGNLSSYISGIGVFYPDKRPTQRIGIVPDIAVTPTIAAMRAGRDELIEEAMRQIRGQ